MRALLWVVCLLAILWGGYWFVGSRGANAAAEDWFVSHRALGGDASHQGISVRGFPNRFDLTVTEPSVSDGASGVGWRAPFVQIFAMTWKPWHMIAALPNSQTITLPDQTLQVQSDRMMGSLQLIPGADLTLDESVAEADALVITSSLGWQIGAKKAVASSRADPTNRSTHRLGLAVSGFSPEPALAERAGLPAVIEEIYIDADARLTAPLDRHSGANAPRLSALDLRGARLVWGSLRVSAKGALKADTAGFAAGEITIRVDDWRKLPPLLAALGTISPDFAPTLEKGLEVMANSGADAKVLTVVLSAKDGQMRLGPFPIGPAPYWN